MSDTNENITTKPAAPVPGVAAGADGSGSVFERLEAYEQYAEDYETIRPLTFNPADIIREACADLKASLEQQERDAARADRNAADCSRLIAALSGISGSALYAENMELQPSTKRAFALLKNIADAAIEAAMRGPNSD